MQALGFYMVDKYITLQTTQSARFPPEAVLLGVGLGSPPFGRAPEAVFVWVGSFPMLVLVGRRSPECAKTRVSKPRVDIVVERGNSHATNVLGRACENPKRRNRPSGAPKELENEKDRRHLLSQLDQQMLPIAPSCLKHVSRFFRPTWNWNPGAEGQLTRPFSPGHDEEDPVAGLVEENVGRLEILGSQRGNEKSRNGRTPMNYLTGGFL